MKTLLRAAAIGVLLSTAALAQVQAQVVAPERGAVYSTFSLSAHGEVRLAPDMATINFGVMTEARTAAEAMRLNAEKMSQVVAALTRQGIERRDIQTSSLNLSPQYDYRDNQPPLLRGYQAQNQVTVRVNDVGRLGQAIDAVVAAGVNQINGVGFGLKDPAKAEDEARREAVRALQAKAELYAQATGYQINRLLNLSEGGGYSPPPPTPVPMFARAEMAKVDTPIEGGELSVRIDVTAVYEVARAPAR